ncbi:MAG: Glucose-1-phosphate adenylyltransferase [Synergistetes bacterium ADurb.BinA166]|jgi:glucose-1-phosphate adenylyltransferase|nr:MAG: Glucose-1-phosphate adenylyltransferase [Synergistetes bacterium ADurb.BinA166]
MQSGKYGRIMGMVLAGGKGERLMPLTKYRAKPAVHFAAKYRIVDFALSNLVNSGVFAIYVMVQFKSQSLNEHIERGWQFGGALRGRDYFITLVPAQMWRGEHWFQGTADAIYQNLHLVTLFDADRVCIFAADHVYKMDVGQMIEYHLDKQADVTVAANVVPSSEASAFGCIEADATGRITGFVEKPEQPPEIPGRPGFSYVSMGNYIFEREILEESLIEDAHLPTSHDFGRDIIPKLVPGARVFAYDFSTNVLPGRQGFSWREDKPYWRDVGTIKTYWEAHMDLLEYNSEMTFYNPQWPMRTVSYADPPSYICPVEGRSCHVQSTLAAEGSRVLGAKVELSVMSRNSVVLPGAEVEQSIIGEGVVIGENCRLRKVIVDSHNIIPPNTEIGFDPERDAEAYTVDPGSGIVIVGMPKMQLRKATDQPKGPFYWTNLS